MDIKSIVQIEDEKDETTLVTQTQVVGESNVKEMEDMPVVPIKDDKDDTIVCERDVKMDLTDVVCESNVKIELPEIWFQLLAYNNRYTNASLPQIPSRYLRVKNSNFQVSYIKYIAMKLSLESEDEVELYLENQRLDSSMVLHNLLRDWIAANADSNIIKSSVGSSAAEYVMVLTYTRKPQHAT